MEAIEMADEPFEVAETEAQKILATMREAFPNGATWDDLVEECIARGVWDDGRREDVFRHWAKQKCRAAARTIDPRTRLPYMAPTGKRDDKGAEIHKPRFDMDYEEAMYEYQQCVTSWRADYDMIIKRRQWIVRTFPDQPAPEIPVAFANFDESKIGGEQPPLFDA